MKNRNLWRWKVADAVDEWAHRRGLKVANGKAWGWWKFTPFAWLCNRRELSYGVPPLIVYPPPSTFNTTATNMTVTWATPGDGRHRG